ncbi:hypothetical protein [Haliscomenobacter sp.]|uniref:hypothetical protein n=1 Tax=Haliscomenobacter sp. TaxID=2717303 RepID=UPI003BA856E6
MKKNSFLFLLITLIHLSCQKQKCNCESTEKQIIRTDSIVKSILNQPENGLKKYWDRFQEPMLYDQAAESYRFSIVGLLYDYCKIYRVEHKNQQYKLYVKEYAVSTTARFREDSLVSSFSKAISKTQWSNISHSFEENCFWTMPVDIKTDDGYLDGSSWALEGQKQNNFCTGSKFHVVLRNSPKSSKFLKICEEFMALDSLNVRRFY